MSLYNADDQLAAEAVAELCYTNPCTARRIELERRALGPAFRGVQALWSRKSTSFANPNVLGLRERVGDLVERASSRLSGGYTPSEQELRVYAGVVRYRLFDVCDAELGELATGVMHARLSQQQHASDSEPIGCYPAFRREAERLGAVDGALRGRMSPVPHLFATSVQVRLAFELIYHGLIGTSRAAAKLRAATWQSIFSSDMRRYERLLHSRMQKMPTLVLGPSGTGKEVVARSIGLSAHVPFNGGSGRFEAPLGGNMHALNLTALSATLIESELFGHMRGAFTGAVKDRAGYFELCGPYGTVFLDEIGELDPAIQVKLLRVLQSRQLQRVGEHITRVFQGRVVAATNRDLMAERGTGAPFRDDLFYRLNANTLTTPSLAEQLGEAPEDLRVFVEHAVESVLGQDSEAGETAELADMVVDFVERRLGLDYPWPGNVRELEQCVCSLLMQGDYQPARQRSQQQVPTVADLDDVLWHTELGVEELISRYCKVQHKRHGNFKLVAQKLGLDQRTVKTRVAGAARAG